VPWMPGVIRKEVTRHRTRMTARRFVFHAAVSGSSSLFDFFNQPGNPTSHFYVRADGTIEQYVNTDYQAPAQLEGNHDCASVESQDMADGFPAWSGSDVPAWSVSQVAALARIAAWVASMHQIPLLTLPDSRNGRTGYGYHRLGVDPWRVAGGELWSKSYGKVCPGNNRIAQIPQVIARAQQIVGGDDDMTPDQAQTLANIAWTVSQIKPQTDKLTAVQTAVDQTNWGVNDGAAGLRVAVSQLYALVSNLPEVDVDEEALAAALAPLLADQNVVVNLDDEQLGRVADAVADEQAQRLARNAPADPPA